MSREQIHEKGLYFSVVQGTFRTKVEQDHPAAVRRDWKSVDGKTSGTKYERVIDALFGFIKEINFVDSEYGMQIHIKLDENEEGESPIIALPTASREGEDFLKKLPNISLGNEVRLRPFNFEGEKGDEVRGMEVMQQDAAGQFKLKVTNFFRDAIAMKNINGMPDPESSDLSKDEWKMYFLQCRLFLIKYAKQHILPKLQGESDEVTADDYNADAAFDAITSFPGEAQDNTEPAPEKVKSFRPNAAKKDLSGDIPF